jgi:hypothetical protein
MLGWYWVADDLGSKRVFKDKSDSFGDFLD